MDYFDHAGRVMGEDQDRELRYSDERRTKQQYPYSYDPFTTWGSRDPRCNGSVYTDRMDQWDHDKFISLGKKILGEVPNWFGTWCNGAKVEEFLREYMGKPNLKLTRVIEYCNMSTGYPTWRLDYYDPEGPKA
jgi:hypothetical protein